MGSAHTHAEVELLEAAPWQRLAAGHGVLDLGMDGSAGRGGHLPITASRMGHLGDALSRADAVFGLDAASRWRGVRAVAAARVIERSSKLDAARVVAETGKLTHPASRNRLL